jgi:D-glycero-D-manno-heptose 1,7-bisphosphate phosphatase
MSAQAVRAVFLDRDGVLNDPAPDPVDGRFESPLHASDVVLAEGAIEGCRMLHDAGFLLLVASNQPAAAKAKATRQQLREVHDRVVSLLAAGGVTIDDWRYCLHHPQATVPELHGDPCGCRKPAPGMLLELAQAHAVDLAASWMVGDSDADIGAGIAAGCRTALVAHPASAHRRTGHPTPAALAPNLSPAAALICS